jgi:Protein of unknown function (DUF3102)
LQAAVIRTLGKRAVRDVIEIGRRLTDAKAIPGHGGWLPWLDSEFGWTEMTATRYMNMHKLSLKTNTVLDLDLPMGALYLPAVPSTPAEVHDQAQQRSANGEDLSAADVQKMIDDARVKDAENIEAKRRACEIRLRAERKAGQLLQGMEKAKAGRPPQNPSTDATDFRGAPTLTDLGISRDQSSRWQQLADGPDEHFETALAAADKPTTAGTIKAAARLLPPPCASRWPWTVLNVLPAAGTAGRLSGRDRASRCPTLGSLAAGDSTRRRRVGGCQCETGALVSACAGGPTRIGPPRIAERSPLLLRCLALGGRLRRHRLV